MSENRDYKEKLVKEMEEAFERNATFYLLDYVKIPVSKASELRRQLRENECSLRVVKNRLALRALPKEVPDEIQPIFSGPTAVAWTEKNPIVLARLLREFISQNRILKVKGAVVEGRYLAEERFAEIASLTSKDDLMAKMAFLLAYPLTQFLRTMRAPLSSVGSMMNQLKDKK